VGGEDPLPPLGRPLLHVLERVGREDPLGVGPVERPLHRDGGTAPTGLAPAPVRIKPAGHVERLELSSLHGAEHVGEVLEEILIPLVGLRLVVAIGPFEEKVEHLGDGQPPEGGLGVFAPLLQEKHPVALERLVAVLAEGNLTLAELNVPGVLRRPEERLRKSHDEPPVSLSAGPKGSPGPALYARAAGPALFRNAALNSALPPEEPSRWEKRPAGTYCPDGPCNVGATGFEPA